MVLGATPHHVLKLIMRQGIFVAVFAVSAGLLGGLAVSRMLSSLVYGVPVRALKFASVAIVLTTTSLAACAISARRVSRVDSIAALRNQ